ncbi:MAG: (2Fe-2S)-binding protein [Candidatus Muiribacteriota bacterium]
MREEDVIICRCEDGTLADVKDAIHRLGLRSVEEIKRVKRFGMGHCQGKTCGKLIAQIISQELGIPYEDVKPATPRQPAKTVKLSKYSEAGGQKNA